MSMKRQMPKSFELSTHQQQVLSHLGVDAWYLQSLSRDAGDAAYQQNQGEIARLVEEMQADLAVADEHGHSPMEVLAGQAENVNGYAGQSVLSESYSAHLSENNVTNHPINSSTDSYQSTSIDVADNVLQSGQENSARMTVPNADFSKNTSGKTQGLERIKNTADVLANQQGAKNTLALSKAVSLNANLNLAIPENKQIHFPALSETVEAKSEAILSALQKRKEQRQSPVLTAMLEQFETQSSQDTWLIITPPPTAEEASHNQLLGERAEQLFNAWLNAIGKQRSAVYVTPIIKQAVHRQLDPDQSMLMDFLPILAAEIELLKPARILVMGRVATHALLQTKAPLSQLMPMDYQLQLNQNSLFPIMAMPCMRYFLAMPSEKARLWKMTKNLKNIA